MIVETREIQSLPGTYALILQAVREQTITVGKFGRLQVCPGIYIYVGSAFGPGGLQARIGRHLRPSDVRHWHIDYLKPAAAVTEVWFSTHPARLEHAWAGAFQGAPGASIPLPGFGSSDCRCPAHLFYFEQDISPDILLAAINPLGQANILRIYPKDNLLANRT